MAYNEVLGAVPFPTFVDVGTPIDIFPGVMFGAPMAAQNKVWDGTISYYNPHFFLSYNLNIYTGTVSLPPGKAVFSTELYTYTPNEYIDSVFINFISILPQGKSATSDTLSYYDPWYGSIPNTSQLLRSVFPPGKSSGSDTSYTYIPNEFVNSYFDYEFFTVFPTGKSVTSDTLSYYNPWFDNIPNSIKLLGSVFPQGRSISSNTFYPYNAEWQPLGFTIEDIPRPFLNEYRESLGYYRDWGAWVNQGIIVVTTIKGAGFTPHKPTPFTSFTNFGMLFHGFS